MYTTNSVSSIKAIGVAVPPHKISQSHHYSILENANGLSREQKLRLRKIYSKSGIENRYSVLAEFGNDQFEEHLIFDPSGLKPLFPISSRMKLFENFAVDLCEKAVLDCLNKLMEFDNSNITHVVTFSCTGMSAPGLDIQIIDRLNLNKNAERTCINFMGCYAAINALKVANYISIADKNAVVLIVGIELCTLHYNKSNESDQVVANAIFADGAAAAIISFKEIKVKNDLLGLKILNFYSEFEPSGKKDMAWSIGDHGFDLRLSSYVPELLKLNMESFINKLFSKSRLSVADIDFYAIHPGGIKILEACEIALNILPEQNKISYNVLREFGNMSSVTILFVLNETINSLNKSDCGKKVLSCAFGPGLTMESMILEIA